MLADSKQNSQADIIDELRHKVIVAANKLQEQVASAHEHASRCAEHPAALLADCSLNNFEDVQRWLNNDKIATTKLPNYVAKAIESLTSIQIPRRNCALCRKSGA